MGDEVLRRRAWHATALVGAGVLALAVVSSFEASPSEADAISLTGGVTLQERLEAASCESLPAWFVDELWLPVDAQDFYMTESESVLSFTVPLSLSEADASLEQGMHRKGWSSFASGVDGCWTFQKDEGECCWAMCVLTFDGETTSAVFQVQKASEGQFG